MVNRIVNASEIRQGDVLAASLDNEVFSVREVYTTPIPGRNGREVVIKGPLGIIVKKAENQKVAVLV